jgi:hypothetical protein
MKLTPAGLLPLSNRGFGDSGVNENWWLVRTTPAQFMLHIHGLLRSAALC